MIAINPPAGGPASQNFSIRLALAYSVWYVRKAYHSFPKFIYLTTLAIAEPANVGAFDGKLISATAIMRRQAGA